MSRIKLALVAVAVAGAVFVANVGSASATTFACQYFGSTFVLNPAIQLTGGSGVYTWNARGQCSLDDGDFEPATLSSGGNYNNVVCGTNDFTGSATITVGQQSLSVTYTTNVVAFNGAMRGTGQTMGTGSMAFRLSTESHVGQAPDCTDKLDFVGAFAGEVGGFPKDP